MMDHYETTTNFGQAHSIILVDNRTKRTPMPRHPARDSAILGLTVPPALQFL